MKVIFLDFDGVMNNPEVWAREDYHTEPCAEKHVEVLNDIIEKTGAHVVISSSWRLFWNRTQCCDALIRKGFVGKVLGCTPRVSSYGPHRGHEIQEWLDNHPSNLDREFGDVTHYVILDDDADMVHLSDKLVQTDGCIGLTPEHVPAIMNHLS